MGTLKNQYDQLRHTCDEQRKTIEHLKGYNEELHNIMDAILAALAQDFGHKAQGGYRMDLDMGQVTNALMAWDVKVHANDKDMVYEVSVIHRKEEKDNV